MTQVELPLSVPRKAGLSLCDALASFFKVRPHVWIDGKELATVAGGYAWRSRCADLRRAPFNMRIENRQQRIKTPSGKYTISEYRYVPGVDANG